MPSRELAWNISIQGRTPSVVGFGVYGSKMSALPLKAWISERLETHARENLPGVSVRVGPLVTHGHALTEFLMVLALAFGFGSLMGQPVIAGGESWELDFTTLDEAVHRYFTTLGAQTIPGLVDTRPAQ